MTVLRWGLNVGGFLADPDNQHAGAAYNHAAELLSRGALSKQPPEDLQTTPGHPAVGLLQVDVAGQPRWCLVYRGRGAVGFARAGGCRFVFADAGDSALAAWDTAAAEFPETDPTRLQPSQEGVATICRQLLHAVVTKTPKAVVRSVGPNQTADVLTAMQAVLRILPDPVAASYAWSSFPLHVPPRDIDLLTGPIPANFAATQTGTNLLAWESRLPPSSQGDELSERVVDWLTDQALSTASCIDPQSPSADQFVRQIVANHLPINVQDVGTLLRRNPTALLSDRGAHALRDWVEADPTSAIRAATNRQLDAQIQNLIGNYLLAIHERDTTGANPAYFPKGAEPVQGWYRRLAEILISTYPAPSDLQDFLRRTVTAPGRPLGKFDDRCAVNDWFRFMRIDHFLLQNPAADIAQCLENDSPLPTRWVSAIQASNSGDKVLRRAAGIAGRTPRHVAKLSLIAREPDLLIDGIFADAREGGETIDVTWVNDFVHNEGAAVAQDRLSVLVPPVSVDDVIRWLRAHAKGERPFPRSMVNPALEYLHDYEALLQKNVTRDPPTNGHPYNATRAPDGQGNEGAGHRSPSEPRRQLAQIHDERRETRGTQIQSAGFALLYLLIGLLVGAWIIYTFTGG